MKKAFIITVTCVLLFLSVQTIRMYYSGKTIPKYNYLGLDGKYHNNNELPKSSLIFVYFSPECGFCEKAIIELSKLNKTNKTVSFVFVANNKNQIEIKNFVAKNKVEELTSFIYIDTENTFPMDFGLGMTYVIPTILVYSSSGKFVKEMNYKDLATLKF